MLVSEIVPIRSPVLPTFLMVSFAVENAPTTPIPTGLRFTFAGTATIFAPFGVAVAVGVGAMVPVAVAVAAGLPVAVAVAVTPVAGPIFETKPFENPSYAAPEGVGAAIGKSDP